MFGLEFMFIKTGPQKSKVTHSRGTRGPRCEVRDGQGPCSSSEMQAKGQRFKKPLPKSKDLD